nr:MAG TPA: hypothetical protein [Caudoviricetes sp.]
MHSQLWYHCAATLQSTLRPSPWGGWGEGYPDSVGFYCAHIV